MWLSESCHLVIVAPSFVQMLRLGGAQEETGAAEGRYVSCERASGAAAAAAAICSDVLAGGVPALQEPQQYFLPACAYLSRLENPFQCKWLWIGQLPG